MLSMRGGYDISIVSVDAVKIKLPYKYLRGGLDYVF